MRQIPTEGDVMDSNPEVPRESEDTESGPIARQEPAPASRFRRALGWLVDYALVMVPGVAFVVLTVGSLVQDTAAYVGAVGAEAGWSALVRLITHRGAAAGPSLREIASDEWVTFAWQLIGAILLVPMMQFIYQWTLLGWRGRTFGKMLADTRVIRADAAESRLKSGRAFRRAFGTTLLETGLIGIALVFIVIGQMGVGATLWSVAVVAFCANLFTGLGARRRTMIDRLSGTAVVRRSLYADVAQRTVGLVRTASDAAAVAGFKTSEIAMRAGRKGADAAVTAGKAVSDATAVAGQLTRGGAEALARSAPVQQVLNSRVGQQAQAMGAIGAEHAQRLGEQAAGRARHVGDRARQLWQDRQAKRQQANYLPAAPERPADE